MKQVRRGILVLLLAVLLSTLALAGTADVAVEQLNAAVAARETKFQVKLTGAEGEIPDAKDAMQARILAAEWIDVSPQFDAVPSFGSEDKVLNVTLRYADSTGYPQALAAAYDACVREEMSPLQRLTSIYSYLANTIVPAVGYDTACEALIEGKADCYGFAAAFRALTQKAGLNCPVVAGRYDGTYHVWNLAEVDGVWYQVDASRGGADWVPGHVDYGTLLFGSGSTVGKQYRSASENLCVVDCRRPFARSGVSTALTVREDGIWLIRGNMLYCAPFGTDFSDEALVRKGTLLEMPSNLIYAAAMDEAGVVYYALRSTTTGTYALYSYLPGMPEAEQRETAQTAAFGMQILDGGVALVRGGAVVKRMTQRRYGAAGAELCWSWDAGAKGAELAQANVRLLGSAAENAQLIAAFYSADGRLRSAAALGGSAAGSTAGSCAYGCVFALDGAGRPLGRKLRMEN